MVIVSAGLLAENFGRQEIGNGRRCLDAKATLPRAPEKASALRVCAKNWQPVRREIPQTRPCPLNTNNRPVHHLFKTRNGQGDVKFLGRGITGRRRRFVMRAQPYAVLPVGFEIELLINVDDQRQACRHVRRDL